MPGPTMFIRQQVPNATPQNDGLMSEVQAAQLAGLVPGAFPFVIANAFPGGDIGAQINAAAASLVSVGGGTVVVGDGNYVQTTRVVLPNNVTLQLNSGLISNALPGGLPLFGMGDNCSIIGSGYGTRLMDPVVIDQSGVAQVIADNKTFGVGGNLSGAGNINLVVRNLQIIGNPLSTQFSAVSACIEFGSIQNALVDTIYFNNIAGYGAGQGSFSDGGFHADNYTINNCTFLGGGSQNVGIVNCNRVHITGCTFYRSQLSPQAPSIAFIDLEVNGATDAMRDFVISGNIFYPVGGPVGDATGAIQITGATLADGDIGVGISGVISDNVIDSSNSTNALYLAIGIQLHNCRDVIVSSNVLRAVTAAINIVGCSGILVEANNISACGFLVNGDAGVLVDGSINCRVIDNFFDSQNDPTASFYTPSINEINASDYNVYYGNSLVFYPTPSAIPIGGDCTINLVGAHSRTFSNFIYGSPVDAAVIATTAELRALAIPGTRPAGTPAVALLGGYQAQADGGFSLWVFNTASTATDNGVTVVTPHFSTGAGRWLRAPGQIELTTTARNALVLTAADAGLQIFNTSTSQMNYWNGTTWIAW